MTLQLVTYGGTVRFATTDPANPAATYAYLIDDDLHTPHGMHDPIIDLSTGLLDVAFPTLEQIVTAHATPDETLVALGINAGPSVGADRVRVRFARGTTILHAAGAADLRARNANVWLSVTGWAEA